MLISPLPTRGDIILKKGLEAGVMNVEWKSKIDMLKAYPIAIHDSSIYSDGRLACFFFLSWAFSNSCLSALCFLCLQLSDKCGSLVKTLLAARYDELHS